MARLNFFYEFPCTNNILSKNNSLIDKLEDKVEFLIWNLRDLYIQKHANNLLNKIWANNFNFERVELAKSDYSFWSAKGTQDMSVRVCMHL